MIASLSQQQALDLALRTGHTYEGLRGHVIDPTLLTYIPLHLARREAVVPLRLRDGILTVATAHLHPILDEVSQRFPALELQLVLARADELAVALDRVEGN